MNHYIKFSLAAAVFVIVGQGCISFGGQQQVSADGGIWQTADGGNDWTQLAALPQASGVGTIGGVNVQSIEIDPGDDTAYYIGTASNGLFFTYDNGSSWQRPENSSVRDGSVLDVEVDPRNVCTIYALKSDRILKSSNCARTFESVFVESREKEEITALVIDWFNPDVLWAGTSNGEVLRSQDAGATWATEARLKSDITAIEISNSDSRVVLVGTKSKGLHLRNVDDGTFVEYERILKEFKNSDKVYGFAQTANGSKILMNTKYGLLSSTDKGISWESVPLITPPGDVRIWSVVLDPKDAETMYYATSTTFYVTHSGGSSWDALDMPSTRAATAMAVHPKNTNVVIAGFSIIE